MDITILPLSGVTLICIAIMIGSLIIAYVKKVMMTYALIIANLIIFAITFLFPAEVINSLGFRPAFISLELSPQLYTLFTSMFIHSGFAHIFGNMLVFFFMGIAFEERIGRRNFLIIYVIAGVCGALTHSILNLDSFIPLVGASGAIFGILGAFAYAYPRDEVLMPIPIGIMIITRVKVIYAAIMFAVMETIFVYFGSQDNTAHFAHLGGLVSGVVLAALLIRTKGSVSTKVSPTAVYYDSSEVPKTKRINMDSLQQLATTPELKEKLSRIEQENVLQVRDMWLDDFLDHALCPKCGKQLNRHNRRVWCDDQHFRIEY